MVFVFFYYIVNSHKIILQPEDPLVEMNVILTVVYPVLETAHTRSWN
jgi:hypothetical protein